MLERVADRSPGRAGAGSVPGTVLIATHGPGLGRKTDFLTGLVERITAHRPDLAEKIVAWLSGTPLPPLDEVRTILFMFADPIAHFPRCEADARRLARAGRERGIPLINPPFALNNTVKSRQAELWKKAGLPCASGQQAADEAELRAIIERAAYPLILRSDDHHVQEGAAVCRNRTEALEWLAGGPRYPVGALEFVDTREGWRSALPGSVYADFFHKKRAMVLGSLVLNNHVFFSTEPIVGAKTCTFSKGRMDEAAGRLDEMIALDIAYNRAPAESPEVMRAALRALGLGMAAIDYSTRADGSVVLWEANPFFQLPPWSRGLLAGPRRLEERVPHMIDRMIGELERLAGGAGNG